jgi:UDP-N-acetylglucosamine 2-epimerase (non-hydrolysing)
MQTKKVIHLIIAARPNFMKIAPLYHALKNEAWCKPVIIHTGQHYDKNMSGDILSDLNMPEPDIHLQVGGGSHAEQTAGVMVAYEKICLKTPPDYIVVVGDVNATMAVAITAKKLHLKVAHLEAGLRSGDREMPEEINRILTDSISDLLLTPSADGDAHLKREGVSEEKIIRVGNIMMDSFEMLRGKINNSSILDEINITPLTYAAVTMHRPSNVDEEAQLKKLVSSLVNISNKIPLVFPIHPRTKKQLSKFSLLPTLENQPSITLIDPLSYISFMQLISQAKMVITDSGGIQEETTYLNIPCITVRNNTERPITIEEGTNRLSSISEIENNVKDILEGNWQTGKKPKYWDGKTASRVVTVLKKVLSI